MVEMPWFLVSGAQTVPQSEAGAGPTCTCAQATLSTGAAPQWRCGFAMEQSELLRLDLCSE